MSMHQLTATSLSMSHDCNNDCNSYKFILHQIGQYQPRIFAFVVAQKSKLQLTPHIAAALASNLQPARIHRQCNPKTLEVAFLTEPATEFFAVAQLQVLQERYLACGQGLSHAVPTTAANTTFLLRDMWMFGITKSTSELTAVAQTPECRYHLGLGINNVQVAVNGMDGDKRSHLLSLCGQLLKLVLTPCHIETEASQWIRTTAVSYAAEMDGHVLGTLCAVTMALLTNRLDLCIQGLFGAGKSKSMAILILALLELDVDHRLRILFLCKENSNRHPFLCRPPAVA